MSEFSGIISLLINLHLPLIQLLKYLWHDFILFFTNIHKLYNMGTLRLTVRNDMVFIVLWIPVCFLITFILNGWLCLNIYSNCLQKFKKHELERFVITTFARSNQNTVQTYKQYKHQIYKYRNIYIYTEVYATLRQSCLFVFETQSIKI